MSKEVTFIKGRYGYNELKNTALLADKNRLGRS
jgi:hypothetical protein